MICLSCELVYLCKVHTMNCQTTGACKKKTAISYECSWNIWAIFTSDTHSKIVGCKFPLSRGLNSVYHWYLHHWVQCSPGNFNPTENLNFFRVGKEN